MYHIVKTKSKIRPFQVVNVDSMNHEVINTSQGLKSKQSAYKNIVANMDSVFSDSNERFYVIVQDDTFKDPVRYKFYDDNFREMEPFGDNPFKKYIPGKNHKKKKAVKKK